MINRVVLSGILTDEPEKEKKEEAKIDKSSLNFKDTKYKLCKWRQPG